MAEIVRFTFFIAGYPYHPVNIIKLFCAVVQLIRNRLILLKLALNSMCGTVASFRVNLTSLLSQLPFDYCTRCPVNHEVFHFGSWEYDLYPSLSMLWRSSSLPFLCVVPFRVLGSFLS